MIEFFRLPIRTRNANAEPQVALVDGTEVWTLHCKWFMQGDYPATIIGGKQIRLHRLLLDVPEGYVVDHINGDPLDNRRRNLRTVTQAVNTQSRTFKGRGSSQHRGVSLNGTKSNPWRAYAKVDGVNHNLGCHPTEAEAAAAVRRFWEVQENVVIR